MNELCRTESSNSWWDSCPLRRTGSIMAILIPHDATDLLPIVVQLFMLRRTRSFGQKQGGVKAA